MELIGELLSPKMVNGASKETIVSSAFVKCLPCQLFLFPILLNFAFNIIRNFSLHQRAIAMKKTFITIFCAPAALTSDLIGGLERRYSGTRDINRRLFETGGLRTLHHALRSQSAQ
jgi:hypothetical protein